MQLPATDTRGVLYRGGPIVTVDRNRPAADAVATRDGRIVAVGTEADCRRVLGLDPDLSGDGSSAEGAAAAAVGSDGPAVVDLGGRALLPGFVDAHMHPLAMCFYAGRLDLSGATTIAEVLDALSDRARITPPGEWVLGLQLTAEQLQEGRLPTITERDTVGSGRAVVVIMRDGHTSMGNTVALAAAGIRGNRADPPGGAFERDDRGRLTGVCRENATRILLGSVSEPDLEELKPQMEQIFTGLASNGITSAGFILQTDAEGPAGTAGALESVGMMLWVEDLPLGSHSILCGDPARAVDARTSSALHDLARNRVVGGVKLFLDGTLGGRTACLHQPYADDPEEQGLLTLDPKLAAARMEAIHLAGLQICIHAIGDAANELALDLFDELLRRHPAEAEGGPPHRIEHASVLDDASVERFGELGIAAVVQPLFLRSEADWLGTRLGADRASRVYPFRTLLDAGVVLAGSSDAPLEEPDALAGMTAAVTRHGFEPAQSLTAAEALEMYTHGGAVAQGRQHITGRISEGLQADLVVVSDDPTAVAPAAIADVEVCATVARGRVVYRRVEVEQAG